MIALYVGVTTIVHNVPVEIIDNKYATWEGTQRVPTKPIDRFAALNPSGSTEVKIALEEKLSGPSGTYSSVAVRIEISARCDQTTAAIHKATEVLFDEGSKALHHYIQPAMALLHEHVAQEGR